MSANESDISQLRDFYNTTIGGEQSDYEGLRNEVPATFTALAHADTVGRHALDIGYGYGRYAVALAQAGYEVDAIDIIDSRLLNSKLADLALLDQVHVLEQDARSFVPEKTYDFVISKDVLHYFSRPTVSNLLRRIIQNSADDAVHYLVIFSDIQRQNAAGEAVHLEGEADFTHKRLISTLDELYDGWQVNITSEPYMEPSFDPHVTVPYFSADKNTVVCQRKL